MKDNLYRKINEVEYNASGDTSKWVELSKIEIDTIILKIEELSKNKSSWKINPHLNKKTTRARIDIKYNPTRRGFNNQFLIIKMQDEWYHLMNLEEGKFYEYYQCDQLDGLLFLIETLIKPTNINESKDNSKEIKKQRILSYRQKIQEIKDQMLSEIVDDKELTNLEKLILISNNNIFGVVGNLVEIFISYYPAYLEQILNNPKNEKKLSEISPTNKPISIGQFCVDDYFNNRDYERYVTIDLANECEYMDEKITILTNRTTSDKFIITDTEFIDCCYNWVIKNKKIGFKIDW